MRLTGKTVVITGGSSGIGLATAKALAANGAKVGITGRDEKKLREAAAAVGHGAVALVADTTDLEATRAAFAQFAAKLGPIDGVFVNAGIAGLTSLKDAGVAQFEDIVRTNFTGAFFTAQVALPHLRDGASLVFNGSVHAVMGAPGYAAYAGSKAAVRAMVRNLASELAPRGIRVNQVTPGGTRTPIWQGRAEIDTVISAVTPLGRMGEPDDVANAALFLLSDESRHITATELVVDGGAINAPSGAPAMVSAFAARR